jgi:response regulator RpfG family c-di-GMP phosphodiesterase
MAWRLLNRTQITGVFSNLDARLNIIVADRNPHVRRFLKRELETEGDHVLLVENGAEVVQHVFSPHPPDLLILDPDLPGSEFRALLKALGRHRPPLPVVVHTFLADFSAPEIQEFPLILVDKDANSAEVLKNTIRVLRSSARIGGF